MDRRWPVLSPLARIGLLTAAGAVLVGAALWAGSVGPWVGRPLAPAGPQVLPTVTDVPTLPTLPPLPPAHSNPSGSSWDPSVVLYVLGGVLFLALLLIAGSMIRNRTRGSAPKRPVVPKSDEVERSVSMPDPDREFDAREAADYVIACWEQVEQRARVRGHARRPEQTPTEFIDGLQVAFPIEHWASAQLLALYQRARFDHVRLQADTAGKARGCLDVVLAGLATAGVGT